MAGIKEIQKRRKGAISTRKITKTMGMIAASKFRKAMDRAEGATPYIETINQLMTDLMAQTSFQHPLLEKRDTLKNEIVFLITSNQGLCGAYNSNLNRLARKFLEEAKTSGQNTEFRISGKKGISYFKLLPFPVAKKYTEFTGNAAYEPIEAIAQEFIDAYSQGKVDRISVVYTKFLSGSKQVCVQETLLPFTLENQEAKQEKASKGKKDVDFLYIPGPNEILQELLPQAVKAKFFKYFLDAIASEHLARMVAMKSATDSADKMIKKLTQIYNRARQSKITMEILEIMGGAEAIK